MPQEADPATATPPNSPVDPVTQAASAAAPAAPGAPATPAPAAPGAPAPVAAAAAKDPATPDPAAVKPDTGWRETIADQKLRNIADRFNSPGDMAKAIQDLRTDNSQRIKVPGEDASEEERAKFRKALGVPDKPDGYEINVPDGLDLSDADRAVLEAILPIAHEHGVPAAALTGFVGKYLEISKALEGAIVQGLDDFHNQSVTELKREWPGPEYERNITIANRAAEILGGQEFKDFLNTTALATGGLLGDHPMLSRFLAKIGRMTDEGDLMLGATKEEQTSVQAEIDKLSREVPVGSAAYTTKAHQDKLRALYDRLYGHVNIVGAGQRVA